MSLAYTITCCIILFCSDTWKAWSRKWKLKRSAHYILSTWQHSKAYTKGSEWCQWFNRATLSDNVELTHRGLFSSAALIKPLSIGCGGKDGAVLAVAPVRLQGNLSLPVLEAHTGAWLVHPLAVCHHVIDAQPDVLIGADALTDVVVQLVVLVSCQRSAQAAPFGDAIFTGCMEGLFHRISQETLAEDLCAFQTDWGPKIKCLRGVF